MTVMIALIQVILIDLISLISHLLLEELQHLLLHAEVHQLLVALSQVLQIWVDGCQLLPAFFRLGDGS
jgi:hypothetical protein